MRAGARNSPGFLWCVHWVCVAWSLGVVSMRGFRRGEMIPCFALVAVLIGIFVCIYVGVNSC